MQDEDIFAFILRERLPFWANKGLTEVSTQMDKVDIVPTYIEIYFKISSHCAGFILLNKLID